MTFYTELSELTDDYLASPQEGDFLTRLENNLNRGILNYEFMEGVKTVLTLGCQKTPSTYAVILNDSFYRYDTAVYFLNADEDLFALQKTIRNFHSNNFKECFYSERLIIADLKEMKRFTASYGGQLPLSSQMLRATEGDLEESLRTDFLKVAKQIQNGTYAPKETTFDDTRKIKKDLPAFFPV